jgi:hypothetical protein
MNALVILQQQAAQAGGNIPF